MKLMNLHPHHHRLIAGTLLATLAVSTLAPAAFAGRGGDATWKVRRQERPVFAGRVAYTPQRVVEFRHHSHGGGGSTLAGFLGGIAVGAILTSAAQSHASSHVECAPQPVYSAPPQVSCPAPVEEYSFEDPFCRERFSSLDLYMSHVRRHGHHALVAQVIDDRDGDCVDVIRFDNGQWVSCDRDERGNWDYDEGDN
jgi:hypothetical protein